MTTTLPLTLHYAQTLATMAARRTMQPWHVINDGHYSIADDHDVAAWGSTVIWSVSVDQAFSAQDDEKGIDTEPSEPPTYPEPNGRCANCDQSHHTWQCPAIYALLFAEPVMVLDLDFVPLGWAA